MKKSISVLLSLLLILCGIPFTVSAESATLVDVQILWDEMCFVYAPKWDYVTCSYVDDENGWKAVGNANRIMVVNSSAFVVTVAFGCDNMADGITFNFYDNDMMLISDPSDPMTPVELEINPQAQGIVRLLPKGSISDESANDMPLGSVTIHIAVDSQS